MKGKQFMKKTIRRSCTPWLLSINLAIAMFFSGCATQKEHSFNDEFGENLPTQPMFYIDEENDNDFKITVHQGKPSNGAERLINVKQAASAIARAETQRRGWTKWHLSYIQETDKGWMHQVIVEVTREKYGEPNAPKADGNP